MERSLSSLGNKDDSSAVTTNESSKCDTCGEEFKTPLLAMFSSNNLLEEYYACPKCLSKMGNYECNKDEVEKAREEGDSLKLEIEEKAEDTVACPHRFGYLKERSKNTPIPEECLTCSKMINCMFS